MLRTSEPTRNSAPAAVTTIPITMIVVATNPSFRSVGLFPPAGGANRVYGRGAGQCERNTTPMALLNCGAVAPGAMAHSATPVTSASQ